MSKITNSVAIPGTLDDVTPEWLTAALSQKYSEIKVTSSKVDGFMGFKQNKSRIHLKYNKAGKDAGLPASMIIKGSFPGYEAKDNIVDFSNLAEAVSYRDIFSKLELNYPYTYYIGTETKKNVLSVMLLEDLAGRGARYFSVLDSLNYGQVMAFVDAMARFHAQTWQSPEFASGGEWGPESFSGKNTSHLYTEYFGKLIQAKEWDDNVISPRGAALPRNLRDRDHMQAAWDRLLEVLQSCPQVIVHGDEHLGNLFMEQNGTPGFLDPFARPDRWVLGYTYMTITGMDIIDRRNWEEPLLAHYLDTLTKYGAPAPSFEEAWYAYRCATIYPLLVWINNSGKWQPEYINTANSVRAGMAVLDHDAFALLGI